MSDCRQPNHGGREKERGRGKFLYANKLATGFFLLFPCLLFSSLSLCLSLSLSFFPLLPEVHKQVRVIAKTSVALHFVLFHFVPGHFVPVISSRSFRPLIHFVPGHFVPGHFVPWSFRPLVISSPWSFCPILSLS
jgi:hypothetical protein